MRRLFLFLVILLTAATTEAQTFTGTGAVIPDDGTVIEFPITVSGLSPSTIDTTVFGLETVCLNITHTWDSDLEVRLVAPDSTSVLLFTGVGGADDDFVNTCFNADSSVSITAGFAPFTGTFRPMGQMGRVNNGQVGDGVWKLRILDTYPFADIGELFDWSITFGNNPAGYFSLHDSNLPIVSINTGGTPIPTDPKIPADMGIIWNGPGLRNYITDPFNHYNGKIGIEIRGSSSSGMPKKPYGIELQDSLGVDVDFGLLGMPPESDYALIAAYSDKSLMRNPLTYRLWESMGWYAPRGEHVEVLLDGEYIGVYYLCEVIKRDANRVDIAKLDSLDLTGDNLTGGYILKVDKGTGTSAAGWQSLYSPAYNPGGRKPDIFVHYPKAVDLLAPQLDYIHAYCDSFENALYGSSFSDTTTGFRHFMDEESWIDYFLITEFVNNLDGYRSSAFFYKDKDSNGGKFRMGPVWDYDLSMGNGDFCEFWKTDNWAYQFGIVCPGDYWQVPFWWQRLLEDSAYAQRVRCRWEDLKMSQMSLTTVFNWVDSVETYLDESQQRNFTAWPILGVYVWPNYYIAADYKGEVDTLKWYIAQRYAWLDANLPGSAAACLVSASQPSVAEPMQVFPNPFSSGFTLELNLEHSADLQVMICDLAGRVVAQPIQVRAAAGRSQIGVPQAAALPPAMYLLRVTDGFRLWTQKIVKQ